MLSKHSKFQYLIILISITSLMLSACGGTNQTASSQDDIITIGVVNQFEFFEPILDGFKTQMTESGFIEGEDIVYLYDGVAGFDPTIIQTQIDSLLERNVDVFLTLGSTPTAFVNGILEENDLYGVFASVTNPEKQNLVTTLTNPGGRLTGVNIGGPILRKSLEWLLTVAPNRQRVHIFYLKDERLAPPQFEDFQLTADVLNVELVLHELEAVEEGLSIVEGLSPDEDVILSVASQLGDTPLLNLAAENNIPIGTSTVIFATSVTGPSIDFVNMGRQSALLAQQIIRGADAGTLPVEPAQYSLLLNIEYAETIGLSIPDTIVQQAGDVVRVTPVPEATAEVTAEATAEAGD